MHRTTFSRTERRTSCLRSGATLRPWTLEDRLSRNRTPWSRSALRRARHTKIGSAGCGWPNRRRINRTRARLRNNQATRRNLCNRLLPGGLIGSRRCMRRCGRTLWRRRWRRLSLRGNLFHRLCRRRRGGRRLRRHHDARCLAWLRRNQTRSRGSSRGRRHFGFGLTLRGRNRFFNNRWFRFSDRSRSDWRRRRSSDLRRSRRLNRRRRRLDGRSRRRHWRGRLGRYGRRRRWFRSNRSYRFRRCRRFCRSRWGRLFLQDCFQRVARLRDMREVELRFQFFLSARPPLRGPQRSISTAVAEMCLHSLRLVNADGTGVCFLFCDTDLREHVEDRFALHLEFPCQVINSNLVYHPPSIFLRNPLSPHINLTVKRLHFSAVSPDNDIQELPSISSLPGYSPHPDARHASALLPHRHRERLRPPIA